MYAYLSRKTQYKIIAYLGAHICRSKTPDVYFDTDTVEIVQNTGSSVTLSSEQSDILTYKPSTSKVHVLTVHNIVSTRTVKFTVINDHDKKVDLFKLVTRFTYQR